MKCLRKFKWIKLPRNYLPEGRGLLGYWGRLAARAAFRKGKASYCGHWNEVTPGMWSGGIVGLKSILGVKRRSQALQIMNELQELGYIDYSLDRRNKHLTYQIKDWVMHYRDLVWVMGSIPKDLKAELDIPMADLDKLISRLDMELSLDNRRVESRLQAVIRSRILVDRMNEAISFLRTKPHEGELLYQIIYHNKTALGSLQGQFLCSCRQ